MADDRVISVRLRALTGDLESGMRRAGASIRSMQAGADRDLKTLGQSMQSAGRRMTMGLTLPIAAGVAFAAREIISFESAMAGVAKTMDLSESEFEAMSQGIRDMAMELPASREEIAAVVEAAGQLGIAKENALAFARTMIDLGESTNLTADEAATSFAQFANITQMPQENIRALADSLVALGNNGASTEADILELGQRLAGAGDQAGLTEAEILGLASAMADVGINAEMGGTSMSQVMGRMRDAAIEGGPRLEAFADAAGMTSEAFAALFREDPSAAIEAFVEGLARITAEGGTVTPVMEGIGLTGERVRDTLNRLSGAGDGVAESFARANDEFGGGSLAEEAARRYETTGARMEMAWNQITDAAMEVGDVVVPIIAGIAGAAADLAGVFANLPGPVQSAMVMLAGLAAVAGPLVFVAGTLVTAWAAVGPALAAAAGTAAVFAVFHPVLAGLAAAAAVATTAFAVFGGGQDTVSQDVVALTDAMREQNDVVGENSQAWLENQLFEGGGDADVTSLLSALDSASIGVAELEAALAGTDAEFEAFLDRVSDPEMNIGGSAINAVIGLRDDYTTAADRAALADGLAGAAASDAAGDIDGLAQAEQEALTVTEQLEAAWSSLNRSLDQTESAAQARESLRQLQQEAFGMLEGGIDASELDQMRIGAAGYARELQRVAEAAHPGDAIAAQRELVRSMRAARDEIPASILPMWDRLIAKARRPLRLNADNRGAIDALDRVTDRVHRNWDRRQYRAFLDAFNGQALGAIDEANRRGNEFDGRTFTATLSFDIAGDAIARAAAVVGGRASGGPVTAGQPYIIGEKGPELFVPNVNGTVVPNGGYWPAAMGGKGDTHVTYVFAKGVDEAMGYVPPEHRRKGREHLNGRR